MPLQKIDITKGQFSTVDDIELPSPEFASEFKNLLINEAGSNIDRPAISNFASTGTPFGINGLTYFRPADKIVAVSTDRKIYSITQSGVVSNITGTPLAGTSRPVFASDGSFLSIAGGSTILTWDGVGTTTAMAGSPPPSTHIVYLDGYWLTFLLNDQEIRWAGPAASARLTWNTANFFQAEGLPDNIRAMAVLLRELYVFGDNTTEIFQNFGGESVPFSRTFFLQSGIAAPYSLIEADNTLFWLDEKRNFTRMNGRTPTFISGPVAKTVKRLSTVSDCFASRIELDGQYLIVWTFPTSQRSFCYDYKNDIWSEWDTLSNGQSSTLSINSHVFVPDWNVNLVGGPSVGTVSQLNLTNKTELGVPLRRLRRMNYDHGTSNRKRSNYYLFHVKRGVGTPGQAEPVFQVRTNDDNNGWSEPQLIPLGFPGEKQSAIRIRIGGIYRRRQLEISCTDAVEFVLNKIEENVDPMES